MTALFAGIVFFLLSICCFYTAIWEYVHLSKIPQAKAYIDRNGAKAYFFDDNINDIWKFVDKEDNVKFSGHVEGKK